MKKNLAMIFALLMLAEFAYATDRLPRVRLVTKPDVVTTSNTMEHLAVTAPRASDMFHSERFGIRAALSNVILYHKYNVVEDSWEYTGVAKNEFEPTAK